MSAEQKKKLIVGMAEFYGETLTATRLTLYLSAITDMSAEELEEAIKICFRDPTVKRMPLPAVLLEAIRPSLSPEAAANELIGRVLTAVKRYGYSDAQSAKEYVGEMVWKALPGYGGWLDFCQTPESESYIARAQLRERIASQLRMNAKGGRIFLPPPPDIPLRTFILADPSSPEEEFELKREKAMAILLQGEAGRDKQLPKEQD